MNARTEKRRRWRNRLRERAGMADAWAAVSNAYASTCANLQKDMASAIERAEQADATAAYWVERYQCLAGVLHVTKEDQEARAKMLVLDAVPSTHETLTHKFAGLTLYQWATLPDELTAFFGMHEAAAMWRKQMSAGRQMLTLYEGGKPKSVYMPGSPVRQ